MDCTKKNLAVSLLATMAVFYSLVTPLVAALASLLITFALRIYLKNAAQMPTAPGPKPWPILGSLHLMDGYRVRLEYL